MLAYLSHSLGSGNGEASIRRHDAIASAVAWLAFLMQSTPWTVTMPWFAYVVALGPALLDRATASQLRMIARCDALVLTGGMISDNMRAEIRHAEIHQVAVIDLTDLGYQPPELNDPELIRALDSRARFALARLGRDV